MTTSAGRGIIGRVMSAEVQAPLPADAIRTGEAIALLAGKPLTQNSRAYVRHQARLVRGAKQGRLTAYGAPRSPRYWSGAEVLALRDSLERDGFTAKPPSGHHARTVRATTSRAELDGLVGLVDAAKLAGVTPAAARKWFERGRFGARKIGGLCFFDQAQVAAHERRAVRQPPETVTCALCGEPFTMKASNVRKARAAAEEAGSDELLVFCSDCWATRKPARSLAHSRRVWRSGYSSPGRAAGLERQWAEGKRDVEAHIERTNKAWRSPTAAVMRVEASTQKRWGHDLSPESKTKLQSKAMSRATLNSDRSRSRREQERRMTEMWTAGETVAQIAARLNMTESNVKVMRNRLGLPPRQAGRRPKK